MSIQAVAWALDQDLPARPKLVLVSIANHANHTDGYCWLKAETIAREASCKPRSVYRFVGDLIRNGYIRKAPRRGDDGRQRANDYWIMLNRPESEWIAVGAAEEPADEDLSEGDDVSQDVVPPDDSRTYGPTDSGVSLEPVEKHAVSVGPCDSGVSHIESAEPSKTKPEEGGRSSGYTPRRYQPPPAPPPKPVGEVVGRKGEQIFVFEGTPAYDAWSKAMARKSGISRWSLTIAKEVDGKYRRGWYFPTLFPPPAHADPPKEPEPAT